MKVGLLVIATGSLYHNYIQQLIESAFKNFFNEDKLNIYLWTDAIENYAVARQFYINKEPWPYPTLNRYRCFCEQSQILIENDYLFYIDVDMRIIENIGREIIGEGITATLHPCFTIPEHYLSPYENDQRSTAYIPRYRYYAGGFQGGTADFFLRMASIIKDRIELDKVNGITAIWHDESHFNKFLTEHPPAVSLTPSYCFPEDAVIGKSAEIRAHFIEHVWEFDYLPKILALTKPNLKRI